LHSCVISFQDMISGTFKKLERGTQAYNAHFTVVDLAHSLFFNYFFYFCGEGRCNCPCLPELYATACNLW